MINLMLLSPQASYFPTKRVRARENTHTHTYPFVPQYMCVRIHTKKTDWSNGSRFICLLEWGGARELILSKVLKSTQFTADHHSKSISAPFYEKGVNKLEEGGTEVAAQRKETLTSKGKKSMQNYFLKEKANRGSNKKRIRRKRDCKPREERPGEIERMDKR